MNFLRASFAPYWQSVQHALFPQLEQVLGPLTAKQQQLVQTLEVIRVEHQIPRHFRAPGRPPKDRAALARAFVAKAVYDMPTTRVLLDRLDTDVAVRRICGWERRSEVPSESVFSRAFAESSESRGGEVVRLQNAGEPAIGVQCFGQPLACSREYREREGAHVLAAENGSWVSVPAAHQPLAVNGRWKARRPGQDGDHNM